MMRTCPICNKKYSNEPAISRRDNKTEICPKCGAVEALQDMMMQNNEYYISLTRGMQGYYIKVLATDEEVARGYASNYLSRIWCSVYGREDMDRFRAKGYKTVVVNENDPVILNSSPLYE